MSVVLEIIPCDSKKCLSRKHIGGGNYVCIHNNLMISHPELCKEWNYEMNTIIPQVCLSGSNKLIWWICKNNVCGCHLWKATISDRTRGRGCPYCSKRKLCPHNNLAYLYIELCKEWDYERNTNKPEDCPKNSFMCA
jgi:hypothetical protein